MYPKVQFMYSPMGNAWGLFSASAFEGGSDPGVPGQDDDGDNFPDLDDSIAADNEGEVSISDDSGENDSLSFGRGVDPAKTK